MRASYANNTLSKLPCVLFIPKLILSLRFGNILAGIYSTLLSGLYILIAMVNRMTI